MKFDEFWRFLVSSKIENKNGSIDIKQIDGMQRKLDAFYQHLENELDEKQ
jgi:hypothetical protein